LLGLQTQSGYDGGGRCGGSGSGRMTTTTKVVLELFGVILGALSQLNESKLLGAQNTWTKYKEECMEDGR